MFETCVRKVRGSNLCQDIGRSSFVLDERWASTLEHITKPPPSKSLILSRCYTGHMHGMRSRTLRH